MLYVAIDQHAKQITVVIRNGCNRHSAGVIWGLAESG